MRLQKIVMRTRTSWYNKTKEKLVGELGAIRIPGFFFGRVVTVYFAGDDTLPAESIQRKVYRAGISGLIQLNKKYIGKVVELEFEDSDIIDYFRHRFGEKTIGKKDETSSNTDSVQP